MIRCYITDRKSAPSLLDSIARFLNEPSWSGEVNKSPLSGEVKWIQIREKDLSARELAGVVRGAVALALSGARGTDPEHAHDGTNGLCARIIVNGRMDVALAAGAAGVHLPSGSIGVDCWRAIAPPNFLIGASCHSIDEVREAEATGADYALFGPVFAPLSKMSDLGPRGIDGLREAARAVRIPVLALGGITRENTQSCVDAGAAGVAGITMFQTPTPDELLSPPGLDRGQ